MSGPRATPLEKLRMENVALRAQVERLKEALDEMLTYGVEFDDDRLGYISVQLDRDTIAEARAALEETTGGPAPPLGTPSGVPTGSADGGGASTSSEGDDIVDHAYRRLQLKAVALESRLKAAEAVVECARPYLENYNDEALAAYDALKGDD